MDTTRNRSSGSRASSAHLDRCRETSQQREHREGQCPLKASMVFREWTTRVQLGLHAEPSTGLDSQKCSCMRCNDRNSSDNVLSVGRSVAAEYGG
jgi:hypothetical protein